MLILTLGKVFLFFFYFCFQIFSMAFIQYLEAHVPIWNFSMTFWYLEAFIQYLEALEFFSKK